MRACIGLDGGGTKTALALSDGQSHILHTLSCGTASYRAMGVEAACAQIVQAVDALLGEAGVARADVASAAFGLPAYGENPVEDRALEQRLTQALAPLPLTLVNDVVVGFWGALGGLPGIEIVAGTGSIAYGEDADGNTARSGGWSEHFSDEGSGYWAGREAMALFCREADGRAPRGALYELVRAKFALEDDFAFVPLMEREFLPSREKTAGFQRVLLEAANLGDAAAKETYARAAAELVSLAKAVRGQLCFAGEATVCVTGGMLHAGALLTGPLSRLLQDEHMQWQPAKMQPVLGAVLLAERRDRARL